MQYLGSFDLCGHVINHAFQARDSPPLHDQNDVPEFLETRTKEGGRETTLKIASLPITRRCVCCCVLAK